MSSVPSEIINAANAASENLLPEKSKVRYEKRYEEFCEWKKKNGVENITNETILMAFFNEKLKTLKSSTLWSFFSMLKSTIQIRENIDIGKYNKLIKLLKRTNKGYAPKKSKILSMENVLKFLKDAPDHTFLLLKIVLIFGINGACRKSEMCNLLISDIEDTGSIAIVTLRETKSNKSRLFTITAECNSYYYYKKYVTLRPKNIKHDRFFLNYREGKCTAQPIGINTFGTFPRRIAQFLELKDDHLYTGHCFRRTSATFLADSGAGIDTLKRHGGWKSSAIAEGYIEDNIPNKIKIAKNIFKNAVEDTAFPAIVCEETAMVTTISQETKSESTMNLVQNRDYLKKYSMGINNINTCTINIYNNDKK